MNVYLGANEIDPKTLGSLDLEGIYKGGDEVWKNSTPLLCFAANTAGSTIKLIKYGSPTVVTLETSTDGSTWSTYTFGDTITLTNIGDKVYRRNTSETDTRFNTGVFNYYYFVMNGSISGSGDINYLLNKNSTTTVTDYCYCYLFRNCSSLTTAPELSATTLASQCYQAMFDGCNGLTLPPALPATTMASGCYQGMFEGCMNLEGIPALSSTVLNWSCYSYMFYYCPKIKISETQTGEYVNEYRIPITGTGTSVGSGELDQMFGSTGGTFTGTPLINTTYYTSNTIVS